MQILHQVRCFERRSRALLILVAALAVLFPASTVLADQAPPGPTAKYLSRFQVTNQPAQFELVQVGFDFAPGAWTPDHTHGGTTYNTVMAGEITVRENGSEKVYKAGETWSNPVGQVHAAGNKGKEHAIVYTTLLLPRGEKLTTSQQTGSTQGLPPGPASLFVTRFPVTDAPATSDVVQVELDFAPGQWTTVHTHPGAAYSTVIQGELVLRENNAERTFKTGQFWTDPAGQVHSGGNATVAPMATFTSFLIPRDSKELTHTILLAAPVTLPETGAPADGTTRIVELAILTILSGLIGQLLWRRTRGIRANDRG